MKKISTNVLLTLILSLSLGNEAFARDRSHLLINNAVDSIIGLQNLEYSYKAAENLTIGVTAISAEQLKINDIELNGNSYGGIVRYYFEPVFEADSWYLAAAANKTNFEASIISNGTKYTGKSDNSIAAGGGYHWFWNDFNMTLGAMISYKSKIQLKDAAGNQYIDSINPNLGFEIKMGGSF
jgi:hypothetical protein